MYRYVITVAILFGSCGIGPAAETNKPDERTFELTPSPPPKPVLTHQLLFDDLADRMPGNAAILYLDAILLMGPDAKEKGATALEAYEAKDMAAFNNLAGELDMSTVFDELELAGRREECEWQPPFREKGADTLLPHLEPLAHGMTRLIQVKALRQIEKGQLEEAIKTLRLGYEMSNKIGREPIAVSGMVSLAITTRMNDVLAKLMSQAKSPNLYWALAEFPPRRPMFRHALDGERSWAATSRPSLMKLRRGEQISADEWRDLFAYIWSLMDGDRPAGTPAPRHPDPAEAASPELLQQARREYAEKFRLSADEVAKLEPIVVLGDFYHRQWLNLFDEQYKLRGLPYPLMLKMGKEEAARAFALRNKQPDNPFQVFGYDTIARKYAEADRQLAALTAVEALRSYAAAHDGKLPEKLADVTATPVPENPATGEPFEYRVENGTATISDSKFEPALSYTVKIRK
jgi:hypothetical protein